MAPWHVKEHPERIEGNIRHYQKLLASGDLTAEVRKNVTALFDEAKHNLPLARAGAKDDGEKK